MAGFCKKCGRIWGGAYDSDIICDLDCPLSQVPPERLKYRCDVCGSPYYKVPDEFTVAGGL